MAPERRFNKPFQKNNGGSFRRDNGPRFGNKPQFGNSQGPARMYETNCAKCGNTCEVPFRPTGERPVYCRDCFNGKKDAPRGEYTPRDEKPRFAPRNERPMNDFRSAPREAAPDPRIDALKRDVDAMSRKLDTIISMMGTTPLQQTVAEVSATAEREKAERPSKKKVNPAAKAQAKAQAKAAPKKAKPAAKKKK
jgi:CxxC-x17-CxxC domain-containing protein